jgi:hypothetical protein
MNSAQVTFTSIIIPVGMKYILATLCSKPGATNAMIGNKMPKNFLTMFFKEIREALRNYQKIVDNTLHEGRSQPSVPYRYGRKRLGLSNGYDIIMPIAFSYT